MIPTKVAMDTYLILQTLINNYLHTHKDKVEFVQYYTVREEVLVWLIPTSIPLHDVILYKLPFILAPVCRL